MEPNPDGPTWRNVRISRGLIVALDATSKAEGVSQSYYIWKLLADALSVEGTRDRDDGRRFADEDVSRACLLMDDVGQIVLVARGFPAGFPVEDAVVALEVVHLRLVKLVERAEAVSHAAHRRPAWHTRDTEASDMSHALLAHLVHPAQELANG